MRLSYFLVVAMTGLLACGDVVVAASDSRKTMMSEVTSHDQVLSDRELVDDEANTNGKRSLRLRQASEDRSDDSKTDNADPDSDESEEERLSIIQTVNKPRYIYWFSEQMTPRDVREGLGLDGLTDVVRPVKRSIYKGYVKYYNRHCRLFKYEKMAFCLAREY